MGPGGEPDRADGTAAANRKEVVATRTRTITLQRTTYRLPASRAKALEAFLKQHIQAEVLQIEIGTQPARTRKPGAVHPMGPMGAGPTEGAPRLGVGGIGGKGALGGIGGVGGMAGIPGAGGIGGPMGPPSLPVITITTTPDVQQAIAVIIALMRKDELPGGVPGMGEGYNPYGQSSMFGARGRSAR
jgi:hypothetical protein